MDQPGNSRNVGHLNRRLALAGASACLLARAGFASAQGSDVTQKLLTFYIGVGEGAGALDLLARALSIALPKYLPGKPVIAVSSMPGAGGLKMANYVEFSGPPDGSSWGFPPRAAVLPLSKEDTLAARFDPRALRWIGSPSKSPLVGAIWTRTTSVRSIADLAKTSVIVGATGFGQDNSNFPKALNEVAGAKFKVVMGYRSPADIMLAMERGEVQGIFGASWASLRQEPAAEWLRDGRLLPIIQFEAARHPELPDVAALPDIAWTSPDGRALIDYFVSANVLGFPAFLGSRTQDTVLMTMRTAYEAAIRDVDYQATLTTLGLPFDPTTGEDIERTIQRIFDTPDSIKQRALAIVSR